RLSGSSWGSAGAANGSGRSLPGSAAAGAAGGAGVAGPAEGAAGAGAGGCTAAGGAEAGASAQARGGASRSQALATTAQRVFEKRETTMTGSEASPFRGGTAMAPPQFEGATLPAPLPAGITRPGRARGRRAG